MNRGITMLMLSKDELLERLELLDADAASLYGDDGRYNVVIAGSGALILTGYTSRATSDIDVLDATKELYGLFGKYQMNGRISAYENSFLFNYPDRLKLLHSGEKIDFYVVSLEDIVISKLCAYRPPDRDDLKAVAEFVDWDKLEAMASDENELRTVKMSDNQYFYFKIAYKEYQEGFKP